MKFAYYMGQVSEKQRVRRFNLLIVKHHMPSSLAPPGFESHTGPIAITNAGLVLAAPFLQRLWSQLGLFDGISFANESAGKRAVQLMQFLVVGTTQVSESILILNKLMCGLPFDASIDTLPDISASEKEIIEGLLNAMISNWPAMGHTSIAVIRESFLQRDGRLVQTDSGWSLNVEPRSIDVLLSQFSLIKLPWMKDMIHVSWA